ncbi:MAG: carbohydrate-binding protein, partial [Verrucomicrobia bacterium]|nr:carbohydrate-binding protein [Verrucomicrobiota bacterium]
GGSGGGGGNTNGCNGRVCIAPVPPVQGSNVTVMYYQTGGPIASSTNVHIHLGWNNWASVLSPDPLMTFNAASNRWEFTTAAAAFATQLDVVFNNGSGAWDNNSGSDWHFAVQTNGVTPTPQAPPTPTGLTASPANTNQINLTWSAASGATGYIVQRAGSNVAATASTSFNDIGLATATAYCYAITATNSIGHSAPTTSQCATTLAPVTNLPAFNLDGVLDSTNVLVAQNGMTIYAALRGTRLYVATWSPGTNGANDHFIFVTDQLLAAATAAAPWAKTGFVAVATSKPFLAGESVGSYVGWFNAPAGSQAAKAAANSGALEGTIDLAAAFGALPANIYLCSAAYQTADGGALASVCVTNTGANIGTNGFLCIPLAALRDHNGDGIFDRLQPSADFVVQNTSRSNNTFTLNCAAFPGRAYQLSYRDNFASGAWLDLPGASNVCGALQTEVTFTALATNGQRFYRVRLLP